MEKYNKTIIPNVIQHIMDQATEISKMVKRVLDSCSLARTISTETFANLAPVMRIIEISESRKKWGQYGWTQPLSAPFDYFHDCPNTLAEADKMALLYCKTEHLQKLFDVLRTKKIKKDVLEEAIFCFENRKYRACALIVFGIIDSMLIKIQPKDKRVRPSGAKAYKTFSDDILACYIGTISCMDTLFENADDFRLRTSQTNRNFVSHGMAKSVRKKDCIKLFLLLYHCMASIEELFQWSEHFSSSKKTVP